MAAKKSVQNFFLWIFMALIAVSLAGFGVDGFLSQRNLAIGSVGGRDIPADNYFRALQEQIGAIERQTGQALPLAQAQAMGIDAQVRARLVTQAALEAEADRIGVSVGDGNVMRAVTSISAFQGPTGGFDRETYRFALQNAGLTPARFEDDIRRESARNILEAATAAGVQVPANLRGALVSYFSERRDVQLFALDENALDTPPGAPDEAAVEAYYQANIAGFTAPETRAITYAWVTPDMLLDIVEVGEEALAALYQQRIGDFIQPERRLVERLIYPDEASAEAAMARLAEGASFEDLVAERGLSLDDTDMGDMTEAQLGAAGAPVFALAEPGAVTGPHRTTFGPALFRMNAILSAQEVPLEEAAVTLRDELALDAARRRIAGALDDIEDLLAGGASIEDLALETDMELGRIDWEAGSSDGIAAYSEFRAAAQAAATGDFPEAVVLSDGGLLALRLDGVTPPAPRPLDEVRAEAAEGAAQAALREALSAQAQTLASALATQGAQGFSESTGLVAEGYEDLTRLDRLPNLPADLQEAIHATAEGETLIHASGTQVYLGLVTEVSAPDEGDTQTAMLIESIDRELGGALAQDVYGYFARAVEAEMGIRFNQAAIDAVHVNFR